MANDTYNPAWCKERHEKIDREFEVVWKKISGLDGRLWALLVLMVANLAAVIAQLVR